MRRCLPVGSEIKVLSANCQGLRSKEKRNDVLNYLDKLNAGIICLQDTHWVDSDIRTIKQIWNGDCFIKGEKTNSRGVAILIKKNFEYKVLSTFSDVSGNLISINLALRDFTLQLVNIYGPNVDSPEYYAELYDLILKCEQDYIILCGDFNLALEPALDTKKYKSINNPKSRAAFLNILNSCNLTDVYRQLHPETRRYTWHRKKPFQ